jgi:hypothetical protein
MLQKVPQLEERLWKIGAARMAENILREVEPYNQWKLTQIRNLVGKGYVSDPKSEVLTEAIDKVVLLLKGVAKPKEGGKQIHAPALLESIDLDFEKNCKIFIC